MKAIVYMSTNLTFYTDNPANTNLSIFSQDNFSTCGKLQKLDFSFSNSQEESLFQEQIKDFFAAGMTVAVKPTGFCPKAIFFDMDATAIAQETIVELADACGKRDEVEKITELAMAGKMDFEESLRKRVKVFAGQPESIIELTRPRLVIEAGLKKFIAKAKEKNVPCYLISGGFVEFAEEIACEAGMEAFHANRLEILNRRLTGNVVGQIVDAKAKAIWLEKICKDLGINCQDAVAVGDGANDLEMMKVAGLSVGYAPKELLFSKVDGLNHTKSHDFLTDFLFD